MDKEWLKEIGATIRSIRQMRRLSIMKLAARCEIDFSALQRIERGRVNTRILTLKRIASELDVDIHEIV
jgi:transcriptional regulator with XRE-family HTH domain